MKNPEFISVTDTKKIESLISSGVTIRDEIRSQTDELCEIRNPELRDIPEELFQKKDEFFKNYQSESVFCYLPWRNICVRVLSKELYQELHTSRNKNLITKEEQKNFREARVAIAGMSVGSNIARICAMQGGSASINVADADSYSISNFNRVLGGIQYLGVKKVDSVIEQLYEVDPFLSLQGFGEGITAENLSSFMTINGKPVDILVEEIDSIDIKLELRKYAEAHRIPVVSIVDNGDGVLVDIERYDEDYTYAQFEERLNGVVIDRTQKPKSADIARIVTNFIGAEDVETRMLESASLVGKELYSWPQLGNAAAMAGSVGSFVVRQIANGKLKKSGRLKISLSQIFGTTEADEVERRKSVMTFYNYEKK
ncbi:MAG TPA: ThiF family adenylyltransferase [Candidatus Magasanikbacteria bacterium]|nr:ThiF family adenylyltransferase [Candidatus Magasanikbacteria bacterium]